MDSDLKLSDTMERYTRLCKTLASAKLVEHTIIVFWFLLVPLTAMPLTDTLFSDTGLFSLTDYSTPASTCFAIGMFIALEWLFGMSASLLRDEMLGHDRVLTPRQIRNWITYCALTQVLNIINRAIQVFLAVTVVEVLTVCAVFSVFLFLDMASLLILLLCKFKVDYYCVEYTEDVLEKVTING